MKRIFDDKKILFIGPLGNPSKQFVDKFDIVIRTNGFFSIKTEMHTTRCDALLINGAYLSRHKHTILANLHKLKYVLTFCNNFIAVMKKCKSSKKCNEKVLQRKHIKLECKPSENMPHHPLLLIKLLNYIVSKTKPQQFYVTGINFYQTKQLSKIWAPGYCSKYELRTNVFAWTNFKHNIPANIKFFTQCMKSNKWIQCHKTVTDAVKSFSQNTDFDVDFKNIIEILLLHNKNFTTNYFIREWERHFLKKLDLRATNIAFMGVTDEKTVNHIQQRYRPKSIKFMKTFKNRSCSYNHTSILICYKLVHYFPGKEFLIKFFKKLNVKKIPIIVLHIYDGPETECKKIKLSDHFRFQTFVCLTNVKTVSKYLTNYKLQHESVIKGTKSVDKIYLIYKLKPQIRR